MKDDGHDEASEGVIIPFPDPNDVQRSVGPFCEKCQKRCFAKSEGRGKCGHSVYYAGYGYCCRCALLNQICRACGADISGLARQRKEERDNQNRRQRPGDKSRMKVLKR